MSVDVQTPATPSVPVEQVVQTPQVTPEAKPQEVDLSSRFAALTRKEKALLDRERKAAEIEKKFGKFAQSKPKENPLAWLETGEITIDELIQAKLKEGKPPTADEKVVTVEEKLRRLEEQIAAKEEQSKQEHINRVVQQFKDQIKAHVDSDKGKYELINAHDAYDQVYAVCEQYYEENREKPDFKALEVSKAADLVEDYLFEQAKAKYAKVSKYKKLFLPDADSPEDIKTQATDTPKPQSEPTLTNRGTTPSAKATKLLPREIAIRQIAAQFDRKT